MASNTMVNKASQQPKVKFKVQELIEYLKNIVPDERVVVNDLRNPQPQKIQSLYVKLLKTVIGNQLDIQKIPEQLAKKTYQESYSAISVVMLRSLLRGVFASLQHPTLGFDEMTLMDLLQPKKQRTHHFLSNLVNFCMFYRDRIHLVEETDEELKEKRIKVEEHRQTLSQYNEQMCALCVANEECKNHIAQKRKEISEELATTRLMTDSAKNEEGKLKGLDRAAKKAAERVADLEIKLKNEIARKEALEDQCVSSPDKLEAEVKALHQIVENSKEESKNFWKESGKITDDVERMKVCVANSDVALENVRHAGTALKEAARLKEDLDKKIVGRKGLARTVQELSLEAASWTSKVEDCRRALVELQMTFGEKLDCVTAETANVEKDSIIPNESKLKALESEWKEMRTLQEQLESAITACTRRMQEASDAYLAWAVAAENEVLGWIQSQYGEVEELLHLLRERSTAFDEIVRQMKQ